jgi:hypothetical protein
MPPEAALESQVANPNAPQRDAKGRLLPGHTLTFQHGEDSERVLAALRQEIDAFMVGALVDEGDADSVPTRRRSLIEYRARLHRRIVQLDAAFEERGLFDPKGKLRVQWLQRLEGLVTVAKSVDSLLGLARRAKQVDDTLESYLRRAYPDGRSEAGVDPHEAPGAR